VTASARERVRGPFVVALTLMAFLTLPAPGQQTQPEAAAPPAEEVAPTSRPERRPSATEIDGPRISGGGGIIPVRLVDDRLVISCDISGPRRRIPVNLWLDFDGAYGLQLHNRAAAPLPAETSGGRALALTLHFPDFTMTVPRRELGDEEAFEAFTKYHSHEMGENALVGAIGAQYLKDFSIVLDLARNRIEIRPIGSLDGRVPAIGDVESVVPISEHNDLVWLPVTLLDGRELAMALATSRFDSLIDRAVCETAGRPAGDVGTIVTGASDLARHVAFRPEDVIQVHPRGVGGMIGINLLRSFRIEIDRQSGLAMIREMQDPEFPEPDLAFFRAMVAADPDLITTWLEENDEHRLAREASELLLTLRLEEEADVELLRTALQWTNDSMLEDLRATRMLDLMEELANEGQMDLVIAAGEIGVESGRKDRYPDAVHKIHGRLGEVHLERNEDREAWRHLLSAAFGLPEDGMINLNLGTYYERTGRLSRAFSRYVNAVIKEDSGQRALEGLQRIDGKIPDEERLSLDILERMIAGKVRSDTAPVKFEPSDEEPVTNRTVLVEFFTNAYLGDERRGAIGGALGNQRLLTHFESEHCVFVSYHLPAPQPDPLVNALAVSTAERLQIGRPVVQVVDGTNPGPGAARWRESEAVYDAVREMIIDELARPTEHTLTLEGRVAEGRVTGSVTVTGPRGSEDTGDVLVQVLLVERGVLFPGKSTVVIHRQLARGSMLADDAGVVFDPDDETGAMTISFDRTLAAIEGENEAFLTELEDQGLGTVSRMSTEIDDRSLQLVAIVRASADGAVLQAAQIEATLVEANETARGPDPAAPGVAKGAESR